MANDKNKSTKKQKTEEVKISNTEDQETSNSGSNKINTATSKETPKQESQKSGIVGDTLEQELAKTEVEEKKPQASVNNSVAGLSFPQPSVKVSEPEPNSNELIPVKAAITINKEKDMPKINNWRWGQNIGPEFKAGKTYMVPRGYASLLASRKYVILLG